MQNHSPVVGVSANRDGTGRYTPCSRFSIGQAKAGGVDGRLNVTLPVVLRPYPGELLYSWLARVAAVYSISIRELLTASASLWDLCVMPSGELVAYLCEMAGLSPDMHNMGVVVKEKRDSGTAGERDV